MFRVHTLTMFIHRRLGREEVNHQDSSSEHPRFHIWATLTSTCESWSLTSNGLSCSSTGKTRTSLCTHRFTRTLVQPSPLRLEYRSVTDRTQPSLLVCTASTIASLYLAPSRAHYATLRFLNGFMFFELRLALEETWCKPFFDCMSQTREKISFPVVNWRHGAPSEKKAHSLCLYCATQVGEHVLILFFCIEIQQSYDVG